MTSKNHCQRLNRGFQVPCPLRLKKKKKNTLKRKDFALKGLCLGYSAARCFATNAIDRRVSVSLCLDVSFCFFLKGPCTIGISLLSFFSNPTTALTCVGAMLCDGDADKRPKHQKTHSSLKAAPPTLVYKETDKEKS